MEEELVKVLIADDDEGFLASLRVLIDHQPELRVIAAATNGAEAIELARQLEPDAAVIDLDLPVPDGMAAIARLRHTHPTLCLIVLTGNDDPDLHRAARRAGADEVIRKTELVELLLDRLQRQRAA